MSSQVSCDLSFQSHMQGFITTNSLRLSQDGSDEITDVDGGSDIFLLDYEEKEQKGNLRDLKNLSDLGCSLKVVKVSQYDLKIKKKMLSSSSSKSRDESEVHSCKSSITGESLRSDDFDNEPVRVGAKSIVSHENMLCSSPLPDLISSPEPKISAIDKISDWTDPQRSSTQENSSGLRLIEAHRVPKVSLNDEVDNTRGSSSKGMDEDEAWLKEIREWALKVCECFDTPVTLNETQKHEEKKPKKCYNFSEFHRRQSGTMIVHREDNHIRNVMPKLNNNVIQECNNSFVDPSNNFKIDSVEKFNAQLTVSRKMSKLRMQKCAQVSYTPQFPRSIESFLEVTNPDDSEDTLFNTKDEVQLYRQMRTHNSSLLSSDGEIFTNSYSQNRHKRTNE